MELILLEEKIWQTIQRNRATSYGLTFVIGLPLPTEIGSQIERVQARVETVSPNCFTWYGPKHLHASVVAPLRGRYRDQPPIQRQELPADLDSFTDHLRGLFSQLAPFQLTLNHVQMAEDGSIGIACRSDDQLRQTLSACLQQYPEFEPPKHKGHLHISIGYVNMHSYLSSAQAGRSFAELITPRPTTPIGQMMVRQVWLVHYANRTLSKIVGQVPFWLGVTNRLPTEQLLQKLNIVEQNSVTQIGYYRH